MSLADLATLRRPLEMMAGALNDEACQDALSALDRVEAEIERLRAMVRELHANLAAIGGGPCVCDICRDAKAGGTT